MSKIEKIESLDIDMVNKFIKIKYRDSVLDNHSVRDSKEDKNIMGINGLSTVSSMPKNSGMPGIHGNEGWIWI